MSENFDFEQLVRSRCLFFEPLKGMYFLKLPYELYRILNETVNGKPWHDFASNMESLYKNLHLDPIPQELLDAFAENKTGLVHIRYEACLTEDNELYYAICYLEDKNIPIF